MALVEAYARRRGLYRTKTIAEPVFTDTLHLDLASVIPSMAGPKRPEGRVALGSVGAGFKTALETEYRKSADAQTRYKVEGKDFDLGHGDVVIAAVTSCTNTSNPSVLIGAGLLARNAIAKGIGSKPWVKTSLAPGSQVVAEYLSASGLQKSLDKLGFNLVGFGLHHMHWQFGSPCARNLQDHQRKWRRRSGCAFGQPQFRGQNQP